MLAKPNTSSWTCAFLNDCIKDKERCPFFKRKQSPNNCGFYSILKAEKDNVGQYNEDDRKIIKDFIERLRERWLECINKGTRAPGKATGSTFEKWLLEILQEEVGKEKCKQKEKIHLRIGSEVVEFPSDILCECKHRTAIETKIYFDKQHALMGMALLEWSKEKWIFVSFHKSKDVAVQKILEHLQKQHKNKFLYVVIVEKPSEAIRKIKEFLLQP